MGLNVRQSIVMKNKGSFVIEFTARTLNFIEHKRIIYHAVSCSIPQQSPIIISSINNSIYFYC